MTWNYRIIEFNDNVKYDNGGTPQGHVAPR